MSGPVEGWRPSPGGWVNWHRLVALARYRSAPVRRAVIQAREEGRLIDLTFGQATRWVAFADSGHLLLLANLPFPLEEEA